jgi:hypothetical protein
VIKITSKCPKCHIENIVKTPYGVWKCPGCGYIFESVSITGTMKSEKPISKKMDVNIIFPKNPIAKVRRKKENNVLEVNEIVSTYQLKIKPMSIESLQNDNILKSRLLNAFEKSVNPNGWANLGTLINILRKRSPNFDQKKYGCKKFYELIKKIDLFEIEERFMNNNVSKVIFVKKK